MHVVYPLNGAGRLRNDTSRNRRGTSQVVLVIDRGLRTVVVYMGDRYGDSLNLAAKTELYSTGTRPIEKGTRDECTTRKQKVHSGDRSRFIEP